MIPFQKIIKNKVVLLAVALIIVVALFGGNTFDILGNGEYHTGFSWADINNGETEHLKCGCGAWDVGCWYGNDVSNYEELIRIPMNNNPIVTEMTDEPGGDSVPISIYGCLSTVDGIHYWGPDYGWYVVEIKYSPLGPWQTVLNTKNDQVDSDIISIVSGSTTKQPYSSQQYTNQFLSPVEFKIKGTQTGIMRVTQMTEFEALFGTQRQVQASSRDYAFLISGAGNVDIVGDQGRYLEGETVRFEVDTGYSGATQGGEWVSNGWELKLFDGTGAERRSWDIADDQIGCRVDVNGNPLEYTVPAGSWNSEGSNKWTVMLTNRLFAQDIETYFSITKEEAAKAPEMVSITYDKEKYNLGDDVRITFTAKPNPLGNNRIDGFFIQIRYGSSSSYFYPGYSGTYVSSNGAVSKTISIRPDKGDINMKVEAWAFDNPEYAGGRMSEKMTSTFWVEDVEHNPVSNFWAIVVAIVIVSFFAILAVALPMPTAIRVFLVVLGLVLSIIYWAYVTGELTTWLSNLPWWLRLPF